MKRKIYLLIAEYYNNATSEVVRKNLVATSSREEAEAEKDRLLSIFFELFRTESLDVIGYEFKIEEIECHSSMNISSITSCNIEGNNKSKESLAA